MKAVSSGIWKGDADGIEIVVDENLKTISTVLPGGKLVKVGYREIPTIDNYVVFCSGVKQANWMLNRLKWTV